MEPVTFVIIIALTIFPLWKIFRKAGLNPALSLFVLIPGLGGLIALALLAFMRWSNPTSTAAS